MIKLSSVVSDLLGVSGRRILKALAAGEEDPGKLASLGDSQLRVSRERLQEALTGRVRPAHRLLLSGESGRRRSRFRDEPDQRSGVIPITVPG